MLRSPALRVALSIVAVIGLLAVLRFKPWQRQTAANKTRQELTVGFLPVT